MEEERLSDEWKGTLKNVTHIFKISIFTSIYMTQFGSNLSRYEECGAVHHERVEECSCVSSSIIYKVKRVNMSVTLVTIRFRSPLIFMISCFKASFHFTPTCRSIKVDHSLTKLNFFDKSCPRHSSSNLVEIPWQSLVTKRADGWTETPCILSFVSILCTSLEDGINLQSFGL